MEWPFQQLELTRPAWLAALVLVPLVAFGSRRRLTGFSQARQAASVACRMLLIAVLVLALCGVRVVRPTAERFAVLAVDQSESIADESRRVAESFVAEVVEAGGRDRVVVLGFARRVWKGDSPIVPAGKLRQSPTYSSAAPKPNSEGTNLAAAIELAAALAPCDRVPHVVLLTDGCQTEGDALRVARAAGVEISTVPLLSRAEPEVYVSAVETPGEAPQHESFHVDVVLHSSHQDEGKVTVFRDDRFLADRRAAVAEGTNRVRFSDSIAEEGPVTYTARIEEFRDTLPENNTASGVVFATARRRVLLVESEVSAAIHLATALEGEKIDVDVRRPDGLPTSPAEFADYDALVLSNVPAASLSQPQMDAIAAYVRDLGGGLIVIGGDQALTPGGYRNTTLEELLPVSCEFEKTEERPSLAMALIIDRSGSMEEGGAIALAKEATRRAVDLLEPKDQVGVIAFQDYAEWVSELHPCSDKERVLERIDTITAGGGTNMYPAIERAYLALREAEAELKHVVILTDGVSHPGDFDGLVRRMAESGITVSTVAVGQEAVRPLLEDMARIGKGHHYYCDTAEAVPEIFALEAASASKMGIIEEPVRARAESPLEALEQVDVTTAPSLLGYVQTRAKPAGQLVLASERGDPLLIWWRCGRGVAVAFTSDVQSRWAAAWLDWPQFGRFWAQVVRHALRKDRADGFVLTVDQQDALVTVILEAVDPESRPLDGARTTLTVTDPEHTNRQLSFAEATPGRYVADLATPRPGTYYLKLRVEHGGREVFSARRGFVVGYPEEYRTRPTDDDLLRAIAEATGGTHKVSPAAVLAP
ncbi:MAG: VWA domain-containing protein, partial [Planctomycetota bacterium]